MKTYNHAFQVPFELISSHEGENVTGAELRLAIHQLADKLYLISDKELESRCGLPFDTHVETE